jgi:hypothetical protein
MPTKFTIGSGAEPDSLWIQARPHDVVEIQSRSNPTHRWIVVLTATSPGELHGFNLKYTSGTGWVNGNGCIVHFPDGSYSLVRIFSELKLIP